MCPEMVMDGGTVIGTIGIGLHALATLQVGSEEIGSCVGRKFQVQFLCGRVGRIPRPCVRRCGRSLRKEGEQ